MLLAASSSALIARAESAGEPHGSSRAPRADPLPAPSAPAGQRRPLPDYQGRPPDRPSFGDVLLWVPRALLYPVHLVTDIALRRPLVGGLTWLERHHVPQWTRWLLFWAQGKAGVLPTFFVDFGLRPSVGAYLFWKDLLVPRHQVSVRLAFWGDAWVDTSVSDEFRALRDDSAVFTSVVRYLTRPDRPYYGIGPDTHEADRRFYRVRVFDLLLGARALLRGLNAVSVRVGYRHAGFLGGESPSVNTLPGGAAQAIPGFDEYDLLSAWLRLELDTRNPDRLFSSGSGLRLELFGSGHLDPEHSASSFFRWGGKAAAFYDFSGANHVLGVHVYGELLERVGHGTVPFYELPTLGGVELMRGFVPLRFLGASACEATAEYSYPVWSLLDADLFVSAGNTFDDHFRDFALDRLYLSWGLGLRHAEGRNVSFEALLAFGTNRLDSSEIKVEHVRVVFGVNHGY